MILKFRGGRHDGETVMADSLPGRWRFPVPIPLERMMDEVDQTRPERRALLYDISAELIYEGDTLRLVGAFYDFAGYER